MALVSSAMTSKTFALTITALIGRIGGGQRLGAGQDIGLHAEVWQPQ